VELKKDDVVSDTCVHLILSGKVIVVEHPMHDPFAFKLLSVAKPGIFLGAPIDGGLTNHPTIFAVVASPSAHMI
jgi:hypothetical protein